MSSVSVESFHEVHKASDTDQQLRELLRQDTGKSATQLYKQWRDGELDARIFTDCWPHCSCLVVVAYWHLKLDENTVQNDCFISAVGNGSAIVKVFQYSNAINWTRKNSFGVIEKSTAERVINTVHHPMGPSYGSISKAGQLTVFSLLTPVTGNISLPEGLFFQNLQPSHAEFIANHHPYYKLRYPLAHFKYCLSKGAVGVFTDTTPPNLVCWILRNYDGSLHHLYTVEQYRRRGLASAVVRMTCKHIQDQGDVPFCFIFTDNCSSTTLFTTLGFTESHEQFLLVRTN